MPFFNNSNASADSVQGYYGMLSSFYFGGDATETVIDITDVNQWIDVQLTVDASGLFDNRPTSMQDSQATGHEGDGSDGSPIIFSLEGLDLHSSANFRASMSFDPEEDEGQLESCLLYTSPSPRD